MHMHDYAQAHEELMQMGVKLATFMKNSTANLGSEQYLQFTLITIKVQHRTHYIGRTQPHAHRIGQLQLPASPRPPRQSPRDHQPGQPS